MSGRRYPKHIVLLRPSVAEEGRGVRIAAAVAIAAATLVAALSFHKQVPGGGSAIPGIQVDENSVTLARGAPQWKAITTGVVPAPVEHWTDVLPARWGIDESATVRQGTPLPGRVTAVASGLGMKVKQGQPLFYIALPDPQRLHVEQRKAFLDLQAAKATYAREASSHMAKVALQLAEQRVVSLQLRGATNDSEFAVVAQRDGVITELPVHVGEQLMPGQHLVGIADPGVLEVLVELLEADAVNIAQGTRVRVTSPALPEFLAEGEVDSVSRNPEAERQMLHVRIVVPNPDASLSLHLLPLVSFLSPATSHAVEVPAGALVSTGSSHYVYVEESVGRFVRRAVVAGELHGGRVTISSGVQPGEVLVERGAVLLDVEISLST